jgi:hypothetical protein
LGDSFKPCPLQWTGLFIFSGKKERIYTQIKERKMEIHLVEKSNNFFRLKENLWESGWWPLHESEAAKLVGGKIYFHRGQQEHSFYGGDITGYRLVPQGEHEGLIVFEFKHNKECRDVKTGKGGWVKKIKIVYDDPVLRDAI